MALEATALLGGAAVPARRMRRQCIVITWHASIGLKRHGMAWRFPFGSPPGRFVQFVQLAHSVTKELVVSRLSFCQLRKRKRKHLSSCAHEGQVLSKSSLACCTASAMANCMTFSTCLIFTATHALKLAALAPWNALAWQRYNSAQRTLIASRFRIAGRALTVSCTASGRFKIVDLGLSVSCTASRSIGSSGNHVTPCSKAKRLNPKSFTDFSD